MKLYASVLSLRGREVTAQPLVGKRGVLGWNGQVSFRYLHTLECCYLIHIQVFQGLEVPNGENDTRRLFEWLEAGGEPEEVLSTIEGP